MNIKDALTKHFNLNELHALTDDLGISPDNVLLNGTKDAYVRALVSYCKRHNLSTRLHDLVREQRPFIKIEENLLPNESQSQTSENQRPTSPKNHQSFMQIITQKWELIAATIVILGTLVVAIVSLLPRSEDSRIQFSINVVDDISGDPIVRATVVLTIAGEVPRTRLTDNNGNAVFLMLDDTEKEVAEVAVRATGYSSKSIILSIPEAGTVQQINLMPDVP